MDRDSIMRQYSGDLYQLHADKDKYMNTYSELMNRFNDINQNLTMRTNEFEILQKKYENQNNIISEMGRQKKN